MRSGPKRREFKARLQAGGEGGAWVVLKIPFDVEEAFGTRGRVSVRGTLNGLPFRSSIFPAGDGTHHLMVNKALQQGSRAGPGDTVAVTMEPDTGTRKVEMPKELRAALARSKRARSVFGGLSYSNQKRFADWIAGAKRPETRSARVVKAVALLEAGKTL